MCVCELISARMVSLSFIIALSICYASFRYFKIPLGWKARLYIEMENSLVFLARKDGKKVEFHRLMMNISSFPLDTSTQSNDNTIHRPFSAANEVYMIFWYLFLSFFFACATNQPTNPSNYRYVYAFTGIRGFVRVSKCDIYFSEHCTTGIRLEQFEMTINRANSERWPVFRWLTEEKANEEREKNGPSGINSRWQPGFWHR